MAERKTYTWGTGRRKSAVARVRICPGTGKFEINRRPVDVYLIEPRDRSHVRRPLEVAELAGKIDVFVNTHGGGVTGQAGAIVQGLARAIKVYLGAQPPAAAPAEGEAPGQPPAIKKLRDSGLLTRDARMKERKKYGRRGARRGFQFSKR
ncbi:MAG TPA: 30S ribosomal protein S9 [Gemmatales bacterium]|nr:30S ribosomal protein S9 [Gemmatales bacterium]